MKHEESNPESGNAALHASYMNEAVELAIEKLHTGKAGPFAAVVVWNNKIIGRGWNSVTKTCDPTAHAEVNAIRDACQNVKNFSLKDCAIYSTCEPCPMCFGACLWARLDAIYYASTRHDAADAGFDDSRFYEEFGCSDPLETTRMIPLEDCRTRALEIFETWKTLPGRIDY